jgi:ligand-binding sensor domain-containing protein/AraC-like DNA-binding protein
MRVKIFIVCFLFAVELAALDPGRSINQYVEEQWTTSNGLPGNSVAAIAQTNDGYLWVATRQQLCRFNGIKFKTYRLFNVGQTGYKEVTALNVDTEDQLWIGTRGEGLFKFKDDVFEIFTQKDGLSSNLINCLYNDLKNNLWIGTDDGYLNFLKEKEIFSFDKKSGLREPYIYSISEDSKGNIWIGTRGGGLYRFTNGRFIKIRIKDFNVYDVTSIQEDSFGELWIGTNHGLVRYDGENVELVDRTRRLSGHVIYKIIEDSDGNLWIGTGNGLFRIQRERAGISRIEELMDGSVVRAIFEDREGSIWIGTDSRGLTRLRDGKISTFSAESGLPHEYVVFMHEDRQKNLRIGTMDGLVRFEKGMLNRESMKIEFSDAVVGPICEDKEGNIWFGTYGHGLYQIQKKNGKRIKYTIRNGLHSDSIFSLYSDSQGILWIGTSQGLNLFIDTWEKLANETNFLFIPMAHTHSPMGGGRRLHLKNGTVKTYMDKAGLLKSEIHCIFKDSKNSIWIGTDKGIAREKNGTFLKVGSGKLPPNLMASYIYEDRDNIFWIATKGNGLIRVKGENEVSTFTFTTGSGLYSNTIYQVFEDDNGYFWMSCEKGVFKVIKKNLNDMASGTIKRVEYVHYGKNDGMKSQECSRWGQHSSIKTSDGKLLFGTTKGISIIDPVNIKINKIPPPVIIERVVINNRAIRLGKEKFVFRTLDYIQFYFTASTLISPKRIIFRYKLENHDNTWTTVKASQIKMAHYRKLPPGQYTFRVTAANSDGIWNEKGTSFTFYFEPGFTRSMFFKISVALFILLAVVLFFLSLKKYHLYRKLKRKYKDSSLEPESVERCMKQLLYVMDIEKIYKNDNLSLQSLAKKISISSHILSQIINEQLNKNFSDFVNNYRIEDAKKMLQEADEETSILHICYEVGFNSKSAFYRAFKKFTKMTPSQYQKKLKDK